MRTTPKNETVGRLVLLAGALMLGSHFGALLSLAVTGRAEQNTPLPLAGGGGVALLMWVPWILGGLSANGAPRIALFALIALAVACRITPLGGPGWPAWWLRETAQLALAGLLFLTAWRACDRRWRGLALAMILLFIPFRYWTIQRWHNLVEPASVMRGY